MTDTRLPEQWLLNRDLDKLSHPAWRLLTRALMYCNSQGTDGEIDEIYRRYVFPWGDPSAEIEEIVAIGWMVKTSEGYQIPDWEGRGQSTAAEMAEYREKARAKQKRYRQARKELRTTPVTSDVTGYVGKDRHKDRQGQASYTENSWPVAEIPKGQSDTSVREGEIL